MLTTALLAMMLAACGTRGELAFMPDGAVPGTIETVLVSTARASAAAPLSIQMRVHPTHSSLGLIYPFRPSVSGDRHVLEAQQG